jgi:hypothetical protein
VDSMPRRVDHAVMAGARPRPRPVFRLAVALAALLAVGASFAAPVASPIAAAEPAAWKGHVDLYRDGVFTTQRSWLWCTAADVQIMRNIVAGKSDHTTASQRRYFEWMRQRNRYDLPLSAGVDPQGWAAGLRHFVDARYRLVSSASFDGAIRLAVTRLRLTNRPVALAVSHGNHGWVLTGFSATADPARTKDFTITSVRVTGPLYGLQSKNGYDMPPDKKLTLAQLRRYFTPWRYDPLPMIWDGRYVSIQPAPVSTKAPSAKPTPTPAPSQTTTPMPIPSAPPPSPTPSPSPSVGPSPELGRTAGPRVEASAAPSAGAMAAVPGDGSPPPTPADALAAGGGDGPLAPWLGVAVAALAVGLVLVVAARRSHERR